MPENCCLTPSMLEVGMRRTVRIGFTREEVAQYCALTGDSNAIHRDLDAARLRFPDTRDIIVPGGLVQTRISALFATHLPGDGTLGLTFIPDRLRRPICPGDEIEVTLEITRMLRGGIVELEVIVNDSDGERMTRGVAKVVAPDETYRAWWEQHIAITETETAVA